MKKFLFLIIFQLFFLLGCNSNNTEKNLEVSYLCEGKIVKENISLDFLQNGHIISDYIDNVRFSILDSLYFITDEKYEVNSTPVELNFTKEIKPYSPEYYTAFTVFYIQKAIDYYNHLFDGRIDFNSQTNTYGTNYKNIEITLGDATFLTTPNTYIYIPDSHPSPSTLYHEIGHRAFWYIQSEEGLGIKFKGLSLIHMGFLEYYTVSLNNSPLVGEDMLLGRMSRNADLLWAYPPADSLRLGYLKILLDDTYKEDLKNPGSNIAKLYKTMNMSPEEEQLVDNHRGGMILASTLWRIRQQIGQNECDKLVTQTILALNEYINLRDEFYLPDSGEKIPERIEWYDTFFGLISKDKELYNGKNQDIIVDAFKNTGYPVDKVIL